MKDIDVMFLKLEEYKDKFGKVYPLFTESEPKKVIQYVDEAIQKNQTVDILYPEIFGERKGEYI